jgi:hypothetical protein
MKRHTAILAMLLTAMASLAQDVQGRTRANSGGGGGGSFTLASSNTSVCSASTGTQTCALATASSAGKLIVVGAEALGTDSLSCSLDVSGAMTKQETSQYSFSVFNGQQFYKVSTGADTQVSCSGHSGIARTYISSFNVPGGFGGTIIGSGHQDYGADGTTVETGNFSIPGSGSALTVGFLWGLGNNLTPGTGWSAAIVGWSSGQCNIGGEGYGCLVYKVDTLGGNTDPNGTQTNTGSGRIATGFTAQ